MNPAFQFLGEEKFAAKSGHIPSLGETPAQLPELAGEATVSPLAEKGVLLVAGPDTEKLLQGQLTCDLKQLPEKGSLKGALCDVKGRMVSSFLCLQHGEGVMLVMHRGLLGKTLETLKKYAVFYKVELTDVSDRHAVLGFHGDEPGLGATTGARLASVAERLWLGVVPADAVKETWNRLSGSYRPCGDGLWQYLLICHGEGEVYPDTSEQFIPQMLNYQHTGGVNFRKGCYTGQEIVARMQYLGKLKRRMYHLSLPEPATLEPGLAIGTAEKKDVGTLVMAADAGAGTELLAVLTADGAGAQRLEIGDYSGEFAIVELPYENTFAGENS